MPSDEGGTARAALRASWEENAAAWTAAVRGQKIPSRRVRTDAAVVDRCATLLGGHSADSRALDVGCGEGWLARALAALGADVLGIDASEALIARARATSEAAGHTRQPRYEVASYEELRTDASRTAGPFEVIVCNFALLDERVAATLAALRSRLTPNGRIVVQTVHPWIAVGNEPYEDGWRVEKFTAFEERFPAEMPWYFRTLGSWFASVGQAGLGLAELDEPLHPETRRPLSLLLTLARA